MKTWKHFSVWAILAILGIISAFTACDDGNGKNNESPDVSEPIIASYSATPASITVPAKNSVQLNCTATSANGSAVKSFQWTVEQKPALANPTIANAQTDTATVNNMDVAGTYQFKLVVTGNNDATKTEYVTVDAGLYYVVEFGAFTSGATLDFSPVDPLPKGVVYYVINDKTNDRIDSSTSFQITADKFIYSMGTITFTQIFEYQDGTEIYRQETTASVNPIGMFIGVNPQAIPSVTLKWPAE